MIKATGEYNGKELTIEYNQGKFLFNNEENVGYESLIKDLMQEQYPIGGTFIPEKDDIRNLINVVNNHFFDDTVIAECTEYVENVPFEEGYVY